MDRDSRGPVGRNGGARLKRTLDVAASGIGLLVLSPVFLAVCLLIWLEDGGSPFYIAPRVGARGRPFQMVKFRSMVVHADRSGVDSTAKGDRRITRMGRVIRRFKLDEVSQLWNVLKGDMSLVGPRPQVDRDAQLYTAVERHLLDAKPGITDFSSIVFADEGKVLEGAPDPDLRYHQIIRPWKSRLGLHYLDHRSTWLDLRLVLATLLGALSRHRALAWVTAMLRQTGANATLVQVARRSEPLSAAPPPGATEIVQSRLATPDQSL
jgi:lipopolysaccharide/colanic/teichoic acid biosynthesis glycosyltransferase